MVVDGNLLNNKTIILLNLAEYPLIYQDAFRVRPTPKIRQEFRSCTPGGRRGADASNLVPSPQARLSPLPAANAKERRSNEDKKVDGLKTYGSVYLLMFMITSTTF